MSRPKALVVGASIAGPATAFWLVRAGYEVTVVEQSAGLREGGNGVDIRSEALAVVERMGLLPAVRAKALFTKGLRFVDRNDRERARMPVAKMEAMVRSEDIEIKRGDLAEILYQATQASVEYLFGTTITSIVSHETHVDVGLSTGTMQKFDVVVGADGLHSRVRHLAFGPERAFVRFKNHYFAFSNTAAPFGLTEWTTFYNEPGRSASVFRPASGPDHLNFIFRRDIPLAYDFRDVPAQRLLLRDAFTGMGWHVAALLDAFDRADDFYFDSISQVHLPVWSNGRVVLVGDAAYCASPASGAGAMLALTGAYRLAGALAQGVTTPALAAYEAAQRPLVDAKQNALFTGITVPKSRLGILVRNLVAASPVLTLLGKIQGPERQTELEEYEFSSVAW